GVVRMDAVLPPAPGAFGIVVGIFRLPPQCAFDVLVPVQPIPVAVPLPDDVVGGFEDGLVARLTLAQRLLDAALAGDVAEDGHRRGDGAALVTDRRATHADAPALAVHRLDPALFIDRLAAHPLDDGELVARTLAAVELPQPRLRIV